LVIASAEAKRAGALNEWRLRRPPRAGPAIRPRPKAAPIRPSPRARSSFEVLSAMYA